MINYIFAAFFIIGIFYSFITGINISNEMLTSSSRAIELIFTIIPIMCLWLGIMNIAIESGLLSKLTSFFKPVLKILFPDLKKEDKSLSLISSNIVMNMLGLGNAATPFGLKAMKELQNINKDKEVASRSMITLLVINTASVTIIPTTVISLRMLNKANNPTDILFVSIITTFLSCLFGLVIDRLFYIRRKK